MTNGSSQGLFVIVAVVIFGIFVLISYFLFQDKLKTGLTTVFCESFIITSKNTGFELKKCGVDKESNLSETPQTINIHSNLRTSGYLQYKEEGFNPTGRSYVTSSVMDSNLDFESNQSLTYNSFYDVCSYLPENSLAFESVLPSGSSINISLTKDDYIWKENQIEVSLNNKEIGVSTDFSQSNLFSLDINDFINAMNFKGYAKNKDIEFVSVLELGNGSLHYYDSEDTLTVKVNNVSKSIPIAFSVGWNYGDC